MQPIVNRDRYYQELRQAIGAGDIDELTRLWTINSTTNLRHITQTLINKSLKRIAMLNRLDYVVGVTTFPDLAEAYRLVIYEQDCPGEPNECLRKYAREGNVNMVYLAILQGANDFVRAARIARESGYTDLAKDLQSRI